MSKVKLFASLVLIGLLTVIGSWLLSSAASPGATQAQSDGWPTPIPPDLTVAAQIMAIPTCCDDQNPIIATLSPEQSVLATQAAQSSQLVNPIPLSTAESVSQGQYLKPSEEWATYSDAKFGYSFDYPANFLVVPAEKTGLQTDIFNRRDDGLWYDPYSKGNFHIAIFVFDDKSVDADLESYIHSRHNFDTSFWSITEESKIELTQGYSGIKQVLKPINGQQKTRIFLEHAGKVYVIVSFDSDFNDTFDRLLSTLALP